MNTLELRRKQIARMLEEFEANPPKTGDGNKLFELRLRMFKKQLADIDAQLAKEAR